MFHWAKADELNEKRKDVDFFDHNAVGKGEILIFIYLLCLLYVY